MKNGPDLVVSIKLKQYIPLKTKVVNTKADEHKGITVTSDAIDKGLSAMSVIGKIAQKPLMSASATMIKGVKDAAMKHLFR